MSGVPRVLLFFATIAIVIAVGRSPFAQTPAQPQGPAVGQGRGDAQGQAAGRGAARGGRGAATPVPAGYQPIKVPSSLDGTEQDNVLIVPQRELAKPLGLVVYLHGWNATYTDRRPDIEAEAEKRGWLLIIPNYRGPFVNHCGNPAAQQDIIDSVNWVKARHPVDDKHIYLVGFSGGGFMSLIMAHTHPDLWAAVSSWSGFGDLLVMYAKDKGNNYGASMRACFGGDPDASPEIAAKFRDRSPITYFTPGMRLPPLDLNGQKDDPLVPFQNSLRAFRALAPGLISDGDLTKFQSGQPAPLGTALRIDPLSGREIYLRRELDNLRLTIRPGNHEVLGAPAFEWFDQFTRR